MSSSGKQSLAYVAPSPAKTKRSERTFSLKAFRENYAQQPKSKNNKLDLDEAAERLPPRYDPHIKQGSYMLSRNFMTGFALENIYLSDQLKQMVDSEMHTIIHALSLMDNLGTHIRRRTDNIIYPDERLEVDRNLYVFFVKHPEMMQMVYNEWAFIFNWYKPINCEVEWIKRGVLSNFNNFKRVLKFFKAVINAYLYHGVYISPNIGQYIIMTFYFSRKIKKAVLELQNAKLYDSSVSVIGPDGFPASITVLELEKAFERVPSFNFESAEFEVNGLVKRLCCLSELKDLFDFETLNPKERAKIGFCTCLKKPFVNSHGELKCGSHRVNILGAVQRVNLQRKRKCKEENVSTSEIPS